MPEYVRPWLYPAQRRAIFDAPDVDGKPARYAFIEASAQPLDTTCQTPSGPKPFGSLKVGDMVFSVDGTATQVTGVFPLGKREVYRLRFSDGTETRACGEHLWAVDHYRDGHKVLKTDELRRYAQNSLAMFRFPVCQPMQYPAVDVPIDPWLLGVLIGDGSLCGNALSISTADPEIVERVSRAIPQGYKVVAGGEYSYRIVASQRGAGYEKPCIREKANGFEVCVARRYVGRRKTREEALELHAAEMRKQYGDNIPTVNLRQALAALGLLGLKHNEKFVPDIYLRNSVEVRREILRGIMDTDGSRNAGNGAVIEQTSSRLAGNIEELVRSLGGFAKTVESPRRNNHWKQAYRTNIRHPDIGSFFWLARKTQRPERDPLGFVRKLVAIEPIGVDEVQCISVAHPSSLYLTDGCIVTHNTKAGKTSACIAWLFEQAIQGGEGDNYWWVAPVYAQAKIAFRRMKRGLPPKMYMANNQEMTITLPNGALIWFKSADNPDNLYGDDVCAIVVDEASRVKEEAWHACRSVLTATRGPLRAIGNVKGRKNWFYQLARKAEAGEPGMSWAKLTAWDAVAGGVLAKDEIEDAKRLLPENVFKELYLAEASDDEGNPFGLKHIEACTIPAMPFSKPIAIGADLAKSQDWTVAIGLDQQGAVCGFERWQKKSWGETTAILTKLINFTPALIDSTGVGDPIVEQIMAKCRRASGYTFTMQSKQKLMEGLAVAIQSRKVFFPKGPITAELENFEYEYLRTGVRYTAPPGFHDDCVMALGLAVEQLRLVSPQYLTGALPHSVPNPSPWLDNRVPNGEYYD